MARQRTRRPVLAPAIVVSVALAAVLAAPAIAALGGAYPVQSLGDRGTDVVAIQQLFRHHQNVRGGSTARGVTTGARNPLVVALDGIFGETTDAGVRAFQASRGLPVSGVVDAATWDSLVVPVGPGSTGDAVSALQRELREKRSATSVPIDGVYGATTAAAVKAFQAHMGLPQTGFADKATWRALAWHFELPRFSASALCDYDPPASANWGTAELIATIEDAGRAMVIGGYGQVAVGDLGFEHGGDHPEHMTHEVGLDADLRPMKKANDQCSSGTKWTFSTYDRAATRALAQAVRAATPGHVKEILFNDPVLIREGLTVFRAGHDDHLHVRLCEAAHPVPLYRC